MYPKKVNMSLQGQITVFALDCGATNWRLYRSEYRLAGSSAQILGDPQPAPLTSFVHRHLPAVICLDPAGTGLESFGETAQSELENENRRERVRDYFKPCIGSHLIDDPLQHQKRYTHAQALDYTRLMLSSVVEQLRLEKWRSAPFDDRICFAFAYPVHWRYDHGGQVFEDFARTVRCTFPEGYNGIRFVAEPEGAILSLNARNLIGEYQGSKVTLIIDIGGSTTDIVAACMEQNSGNLEYIGRYGEPFGGGLYDAELTKLIADELTIPLSALVDDLSAFISLRISAQRLKESLSRQLIHTSKLDHVPQRMVTLVMRDGSIFRRMISLDELLFRSVTSRLEKSFSSLIDNALEQIQIKDQEIAQVVLVGGGAQLFTIINYLRDRFGGNKVILADNPEEIVVQGLGLEYGASFQKVETTKQFRAEVVKTKPENKPTSEKSGWLLINTDNEKIPLQMGLTTVGRDEENELRIDNLKASRFHAELRITADSLQVTDLGSTNGTFINGKRLNAHNPQAINDGDQVTFGKVSFMCKQ
jgi:hypothetical protein